jgi:hypothetical protein
LKGVARRRAERSFGYRAVSIGAALILFLKEHNNISLSQVFLFFIQLLPALLHLAYEEYPVIED